MIKKLFVALGLFVASCTANPAFAIDLQRAYKEVLGPTVQLNRNCSATAIYSEFSKVDNKVETIFLTAKHCVKDATDRIHIVYQPQYDSHNRLVEERAIKVKVRGTSYKYDLALLQSVDESKVFTPVAKVAPEDVSIPMGSPVLVAGYPAGFTLTLTEGVFGARESIPYPERTKDSEYFRATPAIYGGNSGGAMFYDLNGVYQLVGVTSAGLNGVSHVSYFTPVDQIRDYVKIALTNKLP